MCRYRGNSLGGGGGVDSDDIGNEAAEQEKEEMIEHAQLEQKRKEKSRSILWFYILIRGRYTFN